MTSSESPGASFLHGPAVRSRFVRRSLLVLSLVVVLLATSGLPVELASSHANQVRSSPVPESELEASPERVVVWFTEAVEARLSRIRVFDANGRQIDNRDSALSPTEPTAVVVTLPVLENGTYTVSWGNVSTTDGHAVLGSFRFAVGEPLSDDVPLIQPPLLQSGADPWLRWVFFAGALTFAGSLIFELMVVVPGLGDSSPGSPASIVFQKLVRLLPKVLWASLALAAVGTVARVLQQAAITFDVSLVEVFGEPLRTVLFETEWGRQWLWTALAILLGAVALEASRQISRAGSSQGEDEPVAVTETYLGQAALAAGLAVLFLTSLSSHSAASPPGVRVPAIFSDLIHLVAAAAWVGGLIHLLFAVRAARSIDTGGQASDGAWSAMASALPRFSRVAILSAGTLVVTGIFSGWMQVTVPEATASPHGWTLVTKMVLLVPLFGIATANAFLITRSMFSPRRNSGRFARLVLIEAVLGVLVLLAAGWLAGLEPARQYASRNGIGVEESISARVRLEEGVTASLKLEPGEPGHNVASLQPGGDSGAPGLDADSVQLRLVFLEEDGGEGFAQMERRESGVWSLDEVELPGEGVYEARLQVVRASADVLESSVRFEVGSGGALVDAIRPGRTATWLFFGIELMLIGALVAGVAGWRSGPVRRTALLQIAPGVLVAVFGLAVVMNTGLIRIGFADGVENPIVPGPASIAAGQATYAENCASCHGERGRGDGPEAGFLLSRPADLSVHVPLHTDHELFEFVRDGIPGTVMRSNAGLLSEEQMWNLVNFMQTLD